eukprot:TRINITY_DN40637_c0_g1_i1.p1 TRINITY_DN40637_c0_g1~~TRINITY_DN40637_c0_g1_i1.p1  ORF type:complete len:226 (+),score=37.42 TRINITY_DN40637_c0_g1_i1:99-680(+)
MAERAPSVRRASPSPAPDGEAAECRICHDVDDVETYGVMIAPCACTGHTKYVHASCLAEWRRSQRRAVQVGRAGCYGACEICGFEYVVDRGALRPLGWRLRHAWKELTVCDDAWRILMFCGVCIVACSITCVLFHFAGMRTDGVWNCCISVVATGLLTAALVLVEGPSGARVLEALTERDDDFVYDSAAALKR